MKKLGENFLHQKDSKLHLASAVDKTVKKAKRQGEKVSQKPIDKIEKYMERWENILSPAKLEKRPDFDRKKRNVAMLKKSLYKNVIIKPENIPDSIYLLEQRIARNIGHGTIELTDKYKNDKNQETINNQKASLDDWIDYLSSPDALYPMWAKYWAFDSVLKMGKFNKIELGEGEEKKELGHFGKRTKDTAAPFPLLIPGALAKTIDAITLKLEQSNKKIPDNLSTKLNDDEYRQLLSNENFSKIYSQFLVETPTYSTEGLQETRGKWVKYEQGSDPQPLVDSLKGYPLEWCTLGIGTARSQLNGGDFYVYYSLDQTREPKIPRLAIRMQDGKIAEPPRGIAPDQNLDPYIGDVLEKKLDEFPDKEQFKKKSADMKRVTEIEKKCNDQAELNKEDLRFLYEIDEKIEGFGFKKDPRIEELRSKRKLSILRDLSTATGFAENEISVSIHDAFSGNIKYHFGNLNLDHYLAFDGQKFPETVKGDVIYSDLSFKKTCQLPTEIDGDLVLERLRITQGVVMPKIVTGCVDLNSLGLEMSESIIGEWLTKIKKTFWGEKTQNMIGGSKSLVLPRVVGEGLFLPNLKSAEGLTLPEEIGGSLALTGLKSTKGLELPEKIRGNLILQSLKSAKDLKIPEKIRGVVYLAGLKSIEGLKLPEKIEGSINLSGLASAEEQKLPEGLTSIGGDLILAMTANIKLPESLKNIGGGLYLSEAENITLPEGLTNIGGMLDLNKAENIKLPEELVSISGSLDLQNSKNISLPAKIEEIVKGDILK